MHKVASGASDTVGGEQIQQSAESFIESFGTNKVAGLSLDAAARRLKSEGPNEFRKGESVKVWTILIDQFKSSVVILLVIATVISFVMKEYLQTAGIVAALFINAAIGFLTEYRAKVSLDGLARLAGAVIRVRREGCEIDLPVTELVRGDIVLLVAGTRVPADLCILESAAFSVDQSPLTGESVPVWKAPDAEAPENRLVSQGTSALSGRAVCVVIATGPKTRMGQLGRMLQEVVSAETPLTKSLDTLGHQLTILVVLLCVLFAALGILRHASLERMLETSIALAVAAIPEGLPVIATLALAAGIRRMVMAKALVRRLSAVETLGCTTVICTDKTGTLTENKMLVTDIVLEGGHLQLSGHGYEPKGTLTSLDTSCPSDDPRVPDLLVATTLCNDARLEHHEGAEGWHIHGDPTEGALITAAVKLGLNDEQLRAEFPRVAEIPFDLNRKRMSTIHAKPDGAGCILFLKGSPATVLPICTYVRSKEGDLDLDEDIRNWFLSQNQELAKRGLRVLAVARRDIERVPDHLDTASLEGKLILLGLVGMSDRPKENVEAAIRTCQDAGIRIVMLTGDQRETAKSVASELGIISSQADETKILSGSDLQRLTDSEIKDILNHVSVLARVTPEMKLDIVKRLQAAGHIVAMTGDGVNDAPALRQSNIGIAMGQSGTDLAREASDLVITDDNFATIVKAVSEGRIIYANISRAVGYLLTASLTSVIAITLGLFTNAALFLEPLQLLYLNLIMHVFAGLGIVLQKGAADVMKHPPRKQTEKLLDRYEQIQILTRSALIGGVSVLAVMADQRYLGDSSATTVALAILSLSLVLQSWSWLLARDHTVGTRWYLNGPMLLSSAINLALLGAAIYVPALQRVLNTRPLNLEHIFVVVLAASLTYLLSIPISGWFKGPQLVHE